jgi:hypothetical protein
VLIAGGWGFGGAIATTELYDPVAGTFDIGPQLSDPADARFAALLPDGRVVFVDVGTGVTAKMFDPVGNAFTPSMSVATDRNNPAVVVLESGKVLLVGGWTGATTAVSSTLVYDPDTGTTTEAGSLNQGRYGHVARLLPDGRVVVVGGQFWGDTGYVPAVRAEVWDPEIGRWSLAGATPRAPGAVVVVLAGGSVLMAGGVDEAGEPTANAYLLGPSTREWSRTGDMRTARNGPAAVGLLDGTALVFGGAGPSAYGPLDGAEIYSPVIIP